MATKQACFAPLPRRRLPLQLLLLPLVGAFFCSPPVSEPRRSTEVSALTRSWDGFAPGTISWGEDIRRHCRGQGGDCNPWGDSDVVARARNRGTASRLRAALGALLPALDEQQTQTYKIVTAWQYEGSIVNVPWRAIGDILFEIGASTVSVNHVDEQVQDEGRDGATVGIAAGDRRIGTFEGNGWEGNDRAMLTFAIEPSRDVATAIEAACSMAGSPTGCFESLDWEEDPVECLDNWEATRSSDGFESVKLGKLIVCPVQRDEEVPHGLQPLRLLEGQGWGDGAHPTTWMCLDFLETTIKGGEEVVDYGMGSGVLATAAALLGAKRVVGVDLDFEIIAHAKQNFLLNGVGGKVSALHTRDVSIGELSGEVVVANMLAGPMRTVMAILVLAVKDSGVLCLSGLRPSDTDVIKREFGAYINWDSDLELTRSTPSSGEWVRLVGRPKAGLATHGHLRAELERDLSDAAVS